MNSQAKLQYTPGCETAYTCKDKSGLIWDSGASETNFNDARAVHNSRTISPRIINIGNGNTATSQMIGKVNITSVLSAGLHGVNVQNVVTLKDVLFVPGLQNITIVLGACYRRKCFTVRQDRVLCHEIWYRQATKSAREWNSLP